MHVRLLLEFVCVIEYGNVYNTSLKRSRTGKMGYMTNYYNYYPYITVGYDNMYICFRDGEGRVVTICDVMCVCL